MFEEPREYSAPILGLRYHSSVIEDIVHDVLWLVVDRGSLDFQEPMPLRVLPKKHSWQDAAGLGLRSAAAMGTMSA